VKCSTASLLLITQSTHSMEWYQGSTNR